MVEMPSSKTFDHVAFSDWIMERVSSAATRASYPDNQEIPKKVLEEICLEIIAICTKVACDTIRMKR